MNSTLHQLKSPLLTGNCIDAKREEIKQFFINTWTTYESLFSQINNDAAFYKKPERLRHPLIFYYGHTATFFINKLMLGKYITKRINPKLEAICAVGVDEMSWDDLNTDNYDWPSVEEVQEYRDTVYGQMLHVIDTMPLALPVQQDSLAWIVLMGGEHERIHLETSSVIMRMLPLEDLTAHDNWQVCNDFGDSPLNSLTSIPGQSVLLGKSTDDDTYGWDNEYGYLTVDVESFKASTFLVSNQEFLEFVEAGGYQKLDYWNDEGKKWLQFKKPTMPVFWLQQDGEYFQRNLNQIIPLPLNWPVEVNYLEAKAFCVWKSKQTDTHIRMPTEAEWYAMYNSSEGNLNERDTLSKNVNLNHYASSCPVDAMAPSQLDNGKQLFDVVGNVWQWSESAIDGFNGFSVHPLYDDFSTPTFDGKHNLIKGGSWISTGNEANKFSRYAFRRHFFQHAGFRYIESSKSDIPLVKVNVYENDTSVSKQLHSNYSENLFNIENYSTLLAKIVSTYAKSTDTELNRCLDLGCSVGRSSFELANTFSHIDGVDFSARTVQHGVQLQQGGVVRYIQEKEGDIVEYNEISLNNLPHISNQMNIDFSQGDASNLKDKFTDYDVILAQNVLENSYEPIQFLDQLPHRLNDKGLLIVASDYKFDEKITLKNKWIGGVKVNGENVTGFDGLSERLSSHFNFLAEQNIPRVIQNTDREYVVSNIHVTVWQKR
jgi:5-histidylcysteine sulfoxide synthase/putative 4-mercaptohistidine N1-methyltranferase